MPYVNSAPETDLFAKNPAKGPGAEGSLRLDFSGYDRADPQEMNALLWSAMKPGTDMPAPVHTALLNTQREEMGASPALEQMSRLQLSLLFA